MFGPKLSTVFRSRWNALFWSGSILLTAYCTIPAQQDQSGADEVSGEAVEALLSNYASQQDVLNRLNR